MKKIIEKIHSIACDYKSFSRDGAGLMFGEYVKLSKYFHKYRWHIMRYGEELPPNRGQDGRVPDSYEMVVRFICDDNEHTEIILQGQGFLNDIYSETGFLAIAKQVSDKIAHYPDKPVPFKYEQLLAWKEIEKCQEVWK